MYYNTDTARHTELKEDRIRVTMFAPGEGTYFRRTTSRIEANLSGGVVTLPFIISCLVCNKLTEISLAALSHR